jgi:hypothetical protein
MTISIKWSHEDILSIDNSLTKTQAIKVLRYLEDNHDSNVGINWEVIKEALNYLKQEGGI